MSLRLSRLGFSVTHPVVERDIRLVEIETCGFVIGLDLGKSSDATAVAVNELVKCERQVWERTSFEPSSSKVKATGLMRHRIVNLHRYPLGTPYPDIYRSVQRVLEQFTPSVRVDLVVDRTGVGAPVVDSMREMGMRPIAVGITGGAAVKSDGAYSWTVPKGILASTLDRVLADERLAITSEAKASEATRMELQNFHAKVSRTGTTTYEAHRDGQHDDLVLAMALAVWWGENLPPPIRWTNLNIFGR